MKKLRFAAIIASSTALLAANAMAGMAQGAAEPGKDAQRMIYEVYAGGINAVTAALDIAYQSEDRYALSLVAETKGFLGRIVPWSGTFETEGWRLDNGTEMPELHQSTAVFRGEHDIKRYKYNRDGSFESYKVVEAGKDKTPQDLDPALTAGTTDALTATLAVMKNIATDGTCEGHSEVFDGKRRFELVFNHEADVVMEETDYNVYSGPAVRCSVEVKPVAGEWHEKPRGWMSIQEQGREKGALPTVWLAQIDEGSPAVPVKIRVKTNYGTLFMHLTDYRNDDGKDIALMDN